MRIALVLAFVMAFTGTACKGGGKDDGKTTVPATTWVRNVPAATPIAQMMRDNISPQEWQSKRDLNDVLVSSFTSTKDANWLFGLETFLNDFNARIQPSGSFFFFDEIIENWEAYHNLPKKGMILEPWHMEQLVLDTDAMETHYEDRYRRNGAPTGFDYYPQPTEVMSAAAKDPLLYSATYAVPMTKSIDETIRDIPVAHAKTVGLYSMDHQWNEFGASATYNWEMASPRNGAPLRGVILFSPEITVYMDDGFRQFVTTHEIGHSVDDQILSSPHSGYPFDYDRDDPSNAFYRISWTDAGDPIRNDPFGIGFVSGYAMTNRVEDFAETYAYYKENVQGFLYLMRLDWKFLSAVTDAEKVATPLFQKYALMRVLFGREFGNDPEITRLLNAFPLPAWTPPPPDGTMTTTSVATVVGSGKPVCGFTKLTPRK